MMGRRHSSVNDGQSRRPTSDSRRRAHRDGHALLPSPGLRRMTVTVTVTVTVKVTETAMVMATVMVTVTVTVRTSARNWSVQCDCGRAARARGVGHVRCGAGVRRGRVERACVRRVRAARECSAGVRRGRACGARMRSFLSESLSKSHRGSARPLRGPSPHPTQGASSAAARRCFAPPRARRPPGAGGRSEALDGGTELRAACAGLGVPPGAGAAAVSPRRTRQPPGARPRPCVTI